jgi:hypothetical protein
MRTLTGAPLPLTEDEFFSLLNVWFPNIFDIKYIIRQCKPSMKGGLQDIAQEMGVGNTVCSLLFLQECNIESIFSPHPASRQGMLVFWRP